MVLGVEDVVDLRGHPLLGNDLLPVRPGVVPVPLPVKPQGQLANLTVSLPISQSHGPQPRGRPKRLESRLRAGREQAERQAGEQAKREATHTHSLVLNEKGQRRLESRPRAG